MKIRRARPPRPTRGVAMAPRAPYMPGSTVGTPATRYYFTTHPIIVRVDSRRKPKRSINHDRHLKVGQLTPTRLLASGCFEAGEQKEVGSTALQAAGGRCASGGVRSAPLLTDPARLSVASKLPPVSGRSDHPSFPSALLAGRAMFRVFPTTSCWVRHRAFPDSQAVRRRSFTPAAFHFLLSVPPEEGTAVPLAFCPAISSFRLLW